jgi:hypothetical protein
MVEVLALNTSPLLLIVVQCKAFITIPRPWEEILWMEMTVAQLRFELSTT